YDVSLELTIPAPAVDVQALHELAARVMSGEGVADGTGLGILITDDDEVRAMNLQFLGIDEPTDVLSFPDEADDFVQGLADEALLGDIAIALPTAERQASTVGHSINAELAHLLTHGILHLCGYDHVDSAEDEAKMRAREEQYLGDLGMLHGH
ncbi:MAG TPA: rRNA maturation RNase YbeY, partial [Tepidiformaceae bacterium]|nr:rRNA maturation RNase YbeY [Tepidiformaceae bacterium]